MTMMRKRKSGALHGNRFRNDRTRNIKDKIELGQQPKMKENKMKMLMKKLRGAKFA